VINQNKTKKYPKIIVLVLTFNGKEYLDECLSSLLNQSYPNYEIWIIDNNSTDGLQDYVNNKFSQIKTFFFKTNHGYAKANNIGMKKAFKLDDTDFVLVINHDTKSDKNMLEELINCYEKNKKLNKKIGLIQPKILLFTHHQKINTLGNSSHYLGFGYCKDYLKKDNKNIKDKEIVSVSGAAMLVSRNYYENIGGFDEDFFMYNEDQNLSWLGLMHGYEHFLASKSIVFHRYSFNLKPYKLYHSEKNRILMILQNYKLKTIFLLFPIILFNEFLLLFYFLFKFQIILKFKANYYIIKNIKLILKKRKEIQRNRLISDKVIIQKFESILRFEGIKLWIFNIINPIYHLYFKILLSII